MTDEDIIRRVTETLRVEASAITSPPDAWAQFATRDVAAVAKRSRRWLLAPAAVVAAAAVAVVVITTSSSPHHSTQVSSTAGPTPSVTPSVVPPTTAAVQARPLAGPVPAGFVPASVTFVSASTGWVLGTAPCSSPPCTSIVRTTDGGRTWGGIPAPRTGLNPSVTPDRGVSTLRFANRLDGWAFGPELWSTHDGGATWHRVSFAGFTATGAVEDVEAADGRVHAAVTDDAANVRIVTSPVGSDDFVPVMSLPIGAGPVPHGQIVLHGTAGWFVQVDRTVVGGARLIGGQWVPWTAPCATAGGPVLLAASSATELVAACDVGVWTAPVAAERLWVSHDGGATFADAVPIPIHTVFGLAASTATSLIAAGDGPALWRSTDAGRTWSTAVNLPSAMGWSEVGMTTATQGVAIADPAQLLMTRDGGRTWAPVTFRSA